MKILLASVVGIGIGVYAETPTGIIGGETVTSDAYSSFISSTGGITPISGLPVNSEIFGVAINSTGYSIIGGIDNTGNEAYAALVSPDGGVTPLSISFSTGTILSTAINESNLGLIGGAIGTNGGSYAALVSSDGTITPLTLSAIAIDSVSLNDSGVGLIGGEGGGAFPYAAYVVDGIPAEITIPTLIPGHIHSVALNDLGNGILGGYIGGDSYASFVTVGGGSPLVLSPIPVGGASIHGVAINHSGLGLIGGVDEFGNVYAGYAITDGTVTPLFGSPFTGLINSVAMNDAGTGLIGGQNGSDLYAALTQSNGTVTPLILTSIGGEINSVSINNAGVGLIGGVNTDSSEAYAALVAPNGTLTLLDLSSESLINSVAVTPASSITTAATPTSSGPYLSTAYTQLAAASALDFRLNGFNKKGMQAGKTEVAGIAVSYNEDNLLASSDGQFPVRATTNTPEKKNTIWVAPFGNYVHLKDQGDIPSYTNEIAGALLAYDHQESNYLVGASLGYAFNYVDYSNGIGHGKVQEELLCIYGSYFMDHFRIASALWGGLYQFSSVRHTLSIITSKGNTHGWILSPHLEMASPWAMDQKQSYFVEPFFMLDWVNSWQNHYTETGSSGFNLKMGNLYGSLLQSEVGLRFYEQFTYGWGDFCLEEKVSYINQAPFHTNSVTTSFVGSASTFPIAVGSTKVENLGALQLMGTFVPKNTAYPFGGFALQATANGSYQSYFASVFTGIAF